MTSRQLPGHQQEPGHQRRPDRNAHTRRPPLQDTVVVAALLFMDLQVAVLLVRGTVTALSIVLAQAKCHEVEPGVIGDLAEPDVQLVVEEPGVEVPAGRGSCTAGS